MKSIKSTMLQTFKEVVLIIAISHLLLLVAAIVFALFWPHAVGDFLVTVCAIAVFSVIAGMRLARKKNE